MVKTWFGDQGFLEHKALTRGVTAGTRDRTSADPHIQRVDLTPSMKTAGDRVCVCVEP